MKKNYVIGLDYGTDSVRALLVDAANGEELASSVHPYGRWAEGLYCDPAKNRFRQHPLDYLEGLEKTITEVLRNTGKEITQKIRAISIDTTGSTPCALDAEGRALSLNPEFRDNPNAMFVLWKDHTAVKEAEEINRHARTWGGEDYTKYVGGIYSSEWFFAKILHVLREDEAVRKAACTWVEHCDWITAVLTGETSLEKIKRSRCAAGHKAMWNEEFQGLPSEEFLSGLDPLFKGLRNRLFRDTYTSDVAAGHLSADWAFKLGLTTDVVIGVGAFDAHMGAVGAEIRPYALSKVMGTSTCDMLIAPKKEVEGKLIKGICGQVDGSIVPGMIGMEAGQSAFGDIYAWFRELLMWPLEHLVPDGTVDLKGIKKELIGNLEREGAKLSIGQSGVVALDWMNGRRTPDANQKLKGAIANLNLGSDAPKIFRALVEATAFGAKKIVECFESQGIPIREVIALGGVAKKSDFVMQIVCDVLNKPIMVARSEQACALGAAMFAATAAGLYKNVQEAQSKMGRGFEKEYKPIPENVEAYKRLYEEYTTLGSFIEKELTS